MPRVVRRKTLRRFEINAHEVADDIIVLRAIEPAHRHAAGVGWRVGIKIIQRLPNPAGDERLFLFVRTLLALLRWHLASLHFPTHRLPKLIAPLHIRRRFKTLQRNLTLRLPISVAGKTVLLNQRPDVLFKRRLRQIRRAHDSGKHQKRNGGGEFHSSTSLPHSRSFVEH